MLYSLYILNKAGGLIYQKDFANGLNKLKLNDYLILAGTFHGIHAITSKIGPITNSSGLEVLEADTFRMQCFQSQTGLKFLVFTDLRQVNITVITKKIYSLYADFVMKNPFYQLDMPIRCEAFDANLGSYIR